AAGQQVAGGELARLPGCEEEGRPSAAVAEDLLGGGGRGRRDGRRALADRCEAARLAARVERLPEEPVEERARGADLEGGPHLAEDLALSRDHRVEACGDPEEVQGRRLVAQAVERAGRGRERGGGDALGPVRTGPGQ